MRRSWQRRSAEVLEAPACSRSWKKESMDHRRNTGMHAFGLG